MGQYLGNQVLFAACLVDNINLARAHQTDRLEAQCLAHKCRTARDTTGLFEVFERVYTQNSLAACQAGTRYAHNVVKRIACVTHTAHVHDHAAINIRIALGID